MADCPPYTKLVDETSEESDMATEEKSTEGHAAPPPYAPMTYDMNPGVPQPSPQPIMMVPPPAASQPTVVMVGHNALPPGVCTVCRVGKIKDTASCCTWFWCCMLLPIGIIPGIIAFCCCCRHPKCTHCGYTI
ncbi:uncharacterized protein LOC122244317 isoform X2 [Penaeus japonicus]|uniref:uncharacterized protein LOC122244317 isoform X2 n=1 Tax=Penaeus japonicus TaxID=27405 RepID=UPI001C71701D|nr:uncharacterized protein LOC122244317 isoform X2 [Penaeus japonicus]